MGCGPFDRFTDAVCGEILFRPAWRGVRAELTAHLEDRAEALKARGVPPEEAEEQAVAAMGDPKRLGKALHKEHWPILGWIELLWPAALMLYLLLRMLVFPALPNGLYLRAAGVDPGQVVWSYHDNDWRPQYGFYITKEGPEYHFYHTTGHSAALTWLVSDKTARVTCHVSYDTVTGEITRYIETPMEDCIVDYEADRMADHVHLRYRWLLYPLGTKSVSGLYHMGLLPAEDIDPAWCADLYQEVDGGLVLFAGFEEGGDWSGSFPFDVPFYDYRYCS